MAKKTRAELTTEAVTTNLPDNNQELITPATERTQLASERESTLNYKDDITGTVGQALVVGADGESIEFEDLTTGNVSVAGSSTSNRVAVWLSGTELQTTSPISIAAGQLILLAQTASSHNIGGGNLYKPPNEGGTRVTGINNTGFGYLNLNNVLAGTRNIALGYNSGSAITSGSNNVVIGSDPGTSIATLSNRIIISDGAGNVRQTFDDTGAATFSSSVTAGGNSNASIVIRASGLNNTVVSSATLWSDTAPLISVKNSSTTANTAAGFQIIVGGGSAIAGVLGIAESTSQASLGLFTGGSGTISEKVRITSGGNVGIGTDLPSVKLDVGGASNTDSTARFSKTSEGTLLLGGNRSTSNCPFIGSENNFDFAFITNNTERVRITSGGVLQAKYGISFPNQSPNAPSTSEILNGYEEGTFTVTMNTANYSATISPNNTTGYYVRVGNQVTVSYYSSTLTITAAGTGDAIIEGFPYTAADETEAYYPLVTTHVNCFTTGIQNGYVAKGTKRFYLIKDNFSTISGVSWGTGGTIMIGGTYLI